MKKEIMNETVNVVLDNETMEAIIKDNLSIVPKSQRKRFDTLTLEQKVSKIQYYQDRAVKIEQWKQSASIVNKVRDLFDKRHATIDDARDVLKFCNEFIDGYKLREIAKLDEEIARLEQMKQSLSE